MDGYEDEDDTHFCIKCHATISGLENYVRHRQAGCCRPVAKNLNTAEDTANVSQQVSYPEIPNADAFFNSLELQSSAKKSPRRTARTRFNRGRKNEQSNRQVDAKKRLKRSHQTDPEDVAQKSIVQGKLNVMTVDAELDNPTDHLSIPSLVGFPDIVASSSTATKPVAVISESGKNCVNVAPLMMKIETPNYVVQKADQSAPLENPLETFMESEESSVQKSVSSKRREVWLGDTILSDLGTTTEASKGMIAHTSGLLRYADYDYANDVDSDDVESPDDDIPDEDSCSGTDDANDPEYPPQGHTGGKWKPGLQDVVSQVENELVEYEGEPDEDCNPERPPSSHTGGKWKPADAAHGQRGDDLQEKEVRGPPPPGHTRGKWVPGARSDQNNGFYCSPCGRRLASRLVYNRHLLSDLHAKRSIKELDGVLRLPRGGETQLQQPVKKGVRGTRRRKVSTWKIQENEEIGTPEKGRNKKSRNRGREVLWCEMCRTRVRRPLMGKHLLSHYHCRVAGGIPRSPEACAFLLNNMANVVRQCPFQCAGCRFYCNTEDTFLRHWRSELHINVHQKISGSFRCTACNFWCESNPEMEVHITSFSHGQAVAMLNGSVPVVITRRRHLPCETCGQHFRYNFQLMQHVSETGHTAETASDVYQSRINCPYCSQVFRSPIALQRHQLSTHVKKDQNSDLKLSEKAEPYFCSVCSLNFPSPEAAVTHRKTPRHKELVAIRKNEEKGIRKQRECPNCDISVANLADLKEHRLHSHPELCHRCPRCGRTFALPQDLALHTRKGECNAEVNSGVEFEGIEVGNEREEVVPGDWRCERCVYATNSQAEFIHHESLHSETLQQKGDGAEIERRNFRCPLCHKSFKKQNYVLRHLRIHTGEKPFPCPSCKTPFASRAKLNVHLIHCQSASPLWVDETGRHRNYVCLECDNAFYTKHALQQHMLRHTGKKYVCGLPGCPTALRTPGELRTHRERVHGDPENVKITHRCAECPYQTTSAAQLRNHQNQRHSGEPDGTAENVIGAAADETGGTTSVSSVGGFRCPYADCHFKSKLKSHLRRHLRLHTGSQPYKCAYCPYASNNFENLRKHILSTRIHPGKTIYECTHCDTFRTNFSRELKAHFLQDHEEIFPSAESAARQVSAMYNSEPDTSSLVLQNDDDDQSSLSRRISLSKSENI
ncbi:zinc finger protein 624 isoform X2 [Athalia rosae]|nr:zinc finger protein 624 isoform X2 [Athalia rosae]